MASWPRAAAIIRAVTPSIPCYSCISTMVQEELGHSYVATCSSIHQCGPAIVVYCSCSSTMVQEDVGHSLMATRGGNHQQRYLLLLHQHHVPTGARP